MRVGLVCPHASPEVPALAPVPATRENVGRVAAELTARGHDVRVYEPGAEGEPPVAATGYRFERVPVEPPTTKPGRLVSHVSAVGRWLADRWTGGWTPEVVHGHFWMGGLAAATAVRSTTIPMVQTFQSLDAERRRHLGAAYAGPGERATLERALGRAVDLAVAHSDDEVAELTRLGLPRSAVTVVPPGVDTEIFQPDGWAQPRTMNLPRVVSVGLEPGHGQDDLIKALRLVGDVELVIVGGLAGGGSAGHAEARRLAEMARQAGVGQQVRFVDAGAPAELAAWYRSAAVVACAPHCVPTDTVALEAMACGVPVVGYEVGGVAEAVVHEVTGRLVDAGDVRGLGRGLRRMVTEETERFAYANAAVDRVRCRYTWDRAAAALERAYERAVEHRRADGPGLPPDDTDLPEDTDLSADTDPSTDTELSAGSAPVEDAAPSAGAS